MQMVETNWKRVTLAAVASLLLAGCGGPTEEDVEARIKALENPLVRFSLDCRRLPDRLDELLDSDRFGWKGPYIEDRKMLLDPWGREFIYLNNDSGNHSVQYLIVSAGPKGTVKAAEAEARARLEAQNMEDDAKTGIRNLESAVDRLEMDCGKLPDSLRALIISSEKAWEGPYIRKEERLKDPWGHEYIYAKQEKDGKIINYSLYSAGPDGVAGTADDVHAKSRDDDKETER